MYVKLGRSDILLFFDFSLFCVSIFIGFDALLFLLVRTLPLNFFFVFLLSIISVCLFQHLVDSDFNMRLFSL